MSGRHAEGSSPEPCISKIRARVLRCPHLSPHSYLVSPREDFSYGRVRKCLRTGLGNLAAAGLV